MQIPILFRVGGGFCRAPELFWSTFRAFGFKDDIFSLILWFQNVIHEAVKHVVGQIALYCVAFDALFAQALRRIGLVQVRNNQDFDTATPIRGAHLGQYLVAGYFWHHQVKQDQVRPLFLDYLKRLLTVVSQGTLIAKQLQTGFINVSQADIIFYNYYLES